MGADPWVPRMDLYRLLRNNVLEANMSHPYYHSISSVKHYGGEVDDYLPIHSWIDQTKAHIVDSRHRLFLHNPLGITLAVSIFSNKDFDVEEICHRHINEDFGFIPKIDRCLDRMYTNVLQDKLKSVSIEQQAERSVKKFGGVIEDYLTIHRWYAYIAEQDRGVHVVLLSSFGVFIAEQVFGVVLKRDSDNRSIPFRPIAEQHILARFGRIPSLQEYAVTIPTESWMMRRARPLSEYYFSEV